MKKLLQFLYWGGCFPSYIQFIPPKLSVVSGPFQGMRYIAWAQGSSHSPKILGTYEKELHPVIELIKTKPFNCIIDIGAAEGYYAVGLATFSENRTRLIAYEMAEKGRNLLMQLAELNQVKNIQVLGECTPSDLSGVIKPNQNCLVVCDVEGFEIELLDPEAVPNLASASILVEVHDQVRPGATEQLYQRFQSTHSIKEILSTDRTWDDFPHKNWFAQLLPRSLALRAMYEGRYPMNWLWMTPKESV